MTGEPTRRRLLKYAAAAAATTGLAGSATASGRLSDAATGPAEDAPYTVVAGEKFLWTPEILIVPKGATVTFVSNQYPHTVTSADTLPDAAECNYNGEGDPGSTANQSFGSVTVESPDDTFNLSVGPGGSGEITYNAAGEFPYYCVPHCDQRMVGTVIVEGP